MDKYSDKHILLVEDEAITALATSKTIEKYGYSVVTAPTGESALDIIKSNPEIDLILMDIDLGKGIDGTETARRILRSHNLPIVFHTSHSEKDMVDRVKGITRYGYVLKNSGEFVLIESIIMAFELFNAYELANDHKKQLQVTNEELQATISEHEATNEQLIESQKEIIEHEKNLEESERRFRSFFESINEGVALHNIVYDTKGNAVDYILIHVNPMFEQILNLKKEDVLGKKGSEVYNYSPPPFLDIYAEVVKSGLPQNFERYVKAFNKYFSISAFSPAPGSFATAFIDITERKENENELLLYKSIIENSTNAITMATPDGKHIYQNQAFTDLFGNPGYDTPVKIHADETVGREVISTIISGEKWTGEVLMKSKDNETLEILLQAYPLKDKKGSVINLVGIHTDITEKNRFGRELLESREQYRGFISQSFDGIFRVDIVPSVSVDLPDDEIIQWIKDNSYLIDANDSFAEMYGLTPEIMTGRPTSILSPGYAERAMQILKSPDCRVKNVEALDYDYKGNPVWVLESYYGEIIDGKLKRIWGAQKNITELKKTEEALKNALQEKNELLKELQHRVKNSFSMISSIIKLEQERQSSGQALNALTIVENRIKSISELYSMLREDITTNVIHFHEYCSSIINALELSYINIKDSVTICTSLQPVKLAWKQAMPLGLIVTELITNSLKYAFPENKKGTVSIELKKENDNIVLIVSDNGIGLPENFDISKDSSLGLELVSTLSKQVNGELVYTVGRGTRFKLTIPQYKNRSS